MSEQKCVFCGHAGATRGKHKLGWICGDAYEYVCRSRMYKKIVALEAELEERTKQRDTQHARANIQQAAADKFEAELENAKATIAKLEEK